MAHKRIDGRNVGNTNKSLSSIEKNKIALKFLRMNERLRIKYEPVIKQNLEKQRRQKMQEEQLKREEENRILEAKKVEKSMRRAHFENEANMASIMTKFNSVIQNPSSLLTLKQLQETIIDPSEKHPYEENSTLQPTRQESEI